MEIGAAGWCRVESCNTTCDFSTVPMSPLTQSPAWKGSITDIECTQFEVPKPLTRNDNPRIVPRLTFVLVCDRVSWLNLKRFVGWFVFVFGRYETVVRGSMQTSQHAMLQHLELNLNTQNELERGLNKTWEKRKNAYVLSETSVKQRGGTGGRGCRGRKRRDRHREFTKATAENHEETADSAKKGRSKRGVSK